MLSKMLFLGNILLVSFINIFSQNMNTSWIKHFNPLGFMSYAKCICQTIDNGFSIAGGTDLNGGQIYLVRATPYGDTLWTKSFGEKNDYIAVALCQTSDNGFMILGNPYNNSTFSILLYRTDSTGAIKWNRNLGTGYIQSMQQIKDKGYILIGSFYVNPQRLYMLRIDSIGDTLWSKNYGGLKESCGNYVSLCNDNGFIITGYTVTSNGMDVSLVRTDSKGDTLWTKSYGSPIADVGTCVKQTSDGGFIILGITWRLDSAVNHKLYLIRADAKGDTLWTRKYGGPHKTQGYSVCETKNGDFVLSGCTANEAGGFFLLRVNSNGDTIWRKTYGGHPSLDSPYQMQQTNDGGFIFAGSDYITNNFEEMFVVRTDANGNVPIQTPPPPKLTSFQDLTVVYNRANRLVSIGYVLPSSGHVRLEVYDLRGSLVKVLENKTASKGDHRVQWDMGKLLAGGVYFVRLTARNISIAKKVIVTR